MQEFSLNNEQVDRAIEQCVACWAKVDFISGILRQHAAVNPELTDDFSKATTFLRTKLCSLDKEKLA